MLLRHGPAGSPLEFHHDCTPQDCYARMLNLRSWSYGGISAELRGNMRAEDWHALQPYITSAGYRYRTLGDALREGAEEGLGYSCFDAEWRLETVLRSWIWWSTIQWGYQGERPVVFKCLKCMSISYEEQALALLTNPELRHHPVNLSADLEQALHVTIEGYDYRLFIFAFAGDYWSECPCTSLQLYVSQMLQIFQYVAFIHQLNVAHLDLCERNVLCDQKSGRLTVIDFEMSAVKPELPPTPFTSWKSRVPESCVGHWPETTDSSKFDPFAADVWSLGFMLLEELPDKWKKFRVPGFEELLRSMVSDEPNRRPTALQALRTLRRLLCDFIFRNQLVLRKSHPSAPSVLSLQPTSLPERPSPPTSGSTRKRGPSSDGTSKPPQSIEMSCFPKPASMAPELLEERATRQVAVPSTSASPSSRRAKRYTAKDIAMCAVEHCRKIASPSLIRIVSKEKDAGRGQRLTAKQRLSRD